MSLTRIAVCDDIQKELKKILTALDTYTKAHTELCFDIDEYSTAMDVLNAIEKGSKDTQHYQLTNTGYGPSPASDGSSNLIVAQKYKVSFNKNGGSGTASDIEVICGGVYGQLPTLTKTGHTFGGWYTGSGLSGTKVTAISSTETGNKTYYAKWTDDIAPVIGTLQYGYQPKTLWQWLIGKESLMITVPVTEEGSGADEITYTLTPEDGTASTDTSAIQGGVAKITVAADFKGTIVITCTDKSGNESASMTVGENFDATGIILENNAPQIAFQVDGSDVSTDQKVRFRQWAKGAVPFMSTQGMDVQRRLK